MNTRFSIVLAAAGLCVAASAAMAQDTTRTYTDARGREVIVHSGMPAPDHDGPKPSFAKLDRDHDGTIDRAEAAAFAPLLNDFAYVAQNHKVINAQQYARWDYR